jgi:hypothetical protein
MESQNEDISEYDISEPFSEVFLDSKSNLFFGIDNLLILVP